MKAIKSLITNHELVYQYTKREVEAKYRGSRVGFIWTVINPLIMLSIYTFVFSQVFNARWGNGNTEGGTIEFGLNLFAGLIVFNIFAESIAKAPTLITSNPNYVKKIIFPLEVLGYAVCGSALINALSGLLILTGFKLIYEGGVNISILLIPVIWIPLTLTCTGLTWVLASLSVFLKDIGNIVSPIISILMFMSPIFYPASMIPEGIRSIVVINPIAMFISFTRELILEGNMMSVQSIILMWLIALLWFEFCYRIMKRLQPRFSDYI